MSKNSILFTKKKIGNLNVENRFVRSATFEKAAEMDGSVGKEYSEIYEKLAKGNIGIIITGMIFTSLEGKSYSHQAGLHSDAMIDGFSSLIEKIHISESKIFAQLTHGGRQTQVKGKRPPAPSSGKPDLIYNVFPRTMSGDEIIRAIKDYGEAAGRAKEAGFDGIQIHGAHGYLVNEFLSPYFNRRNDEWGGTPEKRFRFFGRVYEAIREAVGSSYPVIAKINIQDYTPGDGLLPEEAAGHVERLIKLGIDSIEVSCGTLAFSMFNMSRGSVPVQAFSKTKPPFLRPATKLMLKKMYPERNISFTENYNLHACELLRPIMGNTPLMLVGGIRDFNSMEEIVNGNSADFISLSRPFIRQPGFLKKWIAGDIQEITCTNCNNCLGGLALDKKLKCYQNHTF